MKKKNNTGFALLETLVVTIFVSGVLIFLYIQFTKLDNMYKKSYTYNTVEGLYALEDIRDMLLLDNSTMNYIKENINSNIYIDLKNCEIMSSSEIKRFCLQIMEFENIKDIFITTNKFSKEKIIGYDEEFKNFINLISSKGEQAYRLVASFNNSTYATVRFGDI